MALPSFNQIGRLVADPELKFLPNGTAVADIRLVFSKSKYDQQAQKWVDDRVFWVDGTVWKEAAERIAEKGRKGDKVFITGDLETQSWEKNGEKKSKPVVQVRSFELIPKAERPTGGAQGGFGPQGAPGGSRGSQNGSQGFQQGAAADEGFPF